MGEGGEMVLQSVTFISQPVHGFILYDSELLKPVMITTVSWLWVWWESFIFLLIVALPE